MSGTKEVRYMHCIHMEFIDKIEYIGTHILYNHHIVIAMLKQAHQPIRYS